MTFLSTNLSNASSSVTCYFQPILLLASRSTFQMPTGVLRDDVPSSSIFHRSILAVKRVYAFVCSRVCICLVRPNNESLVFYCLYPLEQKLASVVSASSLSAAGRQPTGLVCCGSKSRIIFLMKVVFDNGILKQRSRSFFLSPGPLLQPKTV